MYGLNPLLQKNLNLVTESVTITEIINFSHRIFIGTPCIYVCPSECLSQASTLTVFKLLNRYEFVAWRTGSFDLSYIGL